MTEDKYLKLDEWEIYYNVIGKGPHVVLFVQGAMVHSEIELKYQIKGLDMEKFTVVVWDPPGYGKSRPLERKITKDVYSENAEYAFRLMKTLKFDYYSLWGACSGGTTSMILAAKHPEVVRSLVLSNTRSCLLSSDIEKILQYKQLDSWTKKALQTRTEMYGEELLFKMWTNWLEVLQEIYNQREGNVCSDLLGDIKCATFILAGANDPFLDHSHASFLQEHINGSLLYVDPEGTHSFHLAKPDEFNTRIQEFLLQH